MTPRVLGLDLSLTATGIATPDGDTHVWKLPAGLGDHRLATIRARTRSLIIVEHNDQQGTVERLVDLVVIEDLPTHAHGAGLTGMVHGAVRSLLCAWDIPYSLVVPGTLKKYATGNGAAKKPAMALEAYKRGGVELADDDNRCDAWWLRAMGLDWLGHPLFPLPKDQRASLTKVTWPDLEEAA